MVEQRETVPLLEHIAQQSASLLRCERATIFLWDRTHQQLVGRPALGTNGELRLPENTGVVGKVIESGHPKIVDDVRGDPNWSPMTDKATGFVIE